MGEDSHHDGGLEATRRLGDLIEEDGVLEAALVVHPGYPLAQLPVWVCVAAPVAAAPAAWSVGTPAAATLVAALGAFAAALLAERCADPGRGVLHLVPLVHEVRQNLHDRGSLNARRRLRDLVVVQRLLEAALAVHPGHALAEPLVRVAVAHVVATVPVPAAASRPAPRALAFAPEAALAVALLVERRTHPGRGVIDLSSLLSAVGEYCDHLFGGHADRCCGHVVVADGAIETSLTIEPRHAVQHLRIDVGAGCGSRWFAGANAGSASIGGTSPGVAGSRSVGRIGAGPNGSSALRTRSAGTLAPVAFPFLPSPSICSPGLAGPGLAGPSLTGPGLACPGLAWPGLACPSLTAPGLAPLGGLVAVLLAEPGADPGGGIVDLIALVHKVVDDVLHNIEGQACSRLCYLHIL
mmetsp:Transcript_35104/g.109185  ORF Transcript_35104/g.109185 Transcript_35104/m.109185 type:complete len:410 (-) Transcript_35104:175-1404(-)